MNRFVKLVCMLGLLLYPASYALAYCSGGCDCCRCPNGPAQCIGSHSSCEAACGLVSESSSGGSGESAGTLFGRALGEALFGNSKKEDSRDYEAERQQQRRDTAIAQNKQGLEAWNKGDWATAAAYFQQALQNSPDDPVIRQNLANAQANMANQQERERQEREAMERQRQNKVAADNMQQSIQNFAQTLNDSPVAGGLDFDGRTSGNAPEGNSGGLDFTASVALPSKTKPARKSPSGDPMVVDARNVPSALPKGLDNAIASVYSSAPPGVSDRVHKGFQAVMERDWKVAKAWFQDALKRDPNNPGLKRLVAMTDLPQQPIRQEAPVDNRNEPAGLGGKSNFKGAFATPTQTKPIAASPTNPNLQRPDSNDMNVLLPGMKESPKTKPSAGAQSQRPDPNDMNALFPDLKAMDDKEAQDFLFGLNAQPPASKSAKSK